MEQQINYKLKQNSKNGGVKIIIIISVILIIGSGIFWWINLTKSEPAGEQWVEFIGPKQDYKLEHPENWIVNEVNSIYVTLNSSENEQIKQNMPEEGLSKYMDDITVAYYESGDNFAGHPTFKDWLEDENNPDRYISNVKNINFAGEEAWEMIMGGDRQGYVIMTEHNGHLYQIGFNNRTKKSELTDIDNKIISSFQFIN